MKTKLFTLLFLLLATVCNAQEEIIEDKEEFPIYEIAGNDTLFLIAEESPIFAGTGLNDLFEYFNNKMVYPETAISKGIEGRVVISFIIDTDGKMKNFIIKQSVHPDLDNEVIRVLKSVPHKWTPAKHNGKIVKFKYILPINFAIPNMQKDDNQIVRQFISANLDKKYEFQIIELEAAKKFNYTTFRNQYVTPCIMEEKSAENQKIFDTIKEFSEQNLIDSYIPATIGTREKGSNAEWSPEWYFLFLDVNRNVLDIFYYYP